MEDILHKLANGGSFAAQNISAFQSYIYVVLDSTLPSASYMRRWTGSALVQVMAYRLFGAEPLPEPMLVFCQSDPWKQISLKTKAEF